MDKLARKKAVITGGSRGIGKAIAEAYLKEGASVFLLARNEGELAATKAELGTLGNVLTMKADVSRPEDIEAAARELRTAWGNIDILVCAAAIYGPIAPIIETDTEKWLQAIGIDLFGTFLAIHAFGKIMKEAGTGTIITFSGGGEGAFANFSAYAAAKGGIVRLTEAAAAELSPYSVYVNAITPGPVNTAFLDELIVAGPEKAGVLNFQRALKQKNEGGTPPSVAADLCVFLASETARGITGKLFSAVWDPYETFPAHREEIMNFDIYTVRRILPRDRGFGWGEKEKRS